MELVGGGLQAPQAARTGIAPDQRPETIPPETFVALARELRAIGRPLTQ